MIGKVSDLNCPRVVDPAYKKGDDFSLRVYSISEESPYLIVKNVMKNL